MHFDVVNGTCQVGEVGIVRSYMFRFSENGRRKASNASLEGVRVVCSLTK